MKNIKVLWVFIYLMGSSPIQAQMPAAASAGMTRIGAAAMVRGRVEARFPGPQAIGRVMGSGQPLYLNDEVTTDAAGRMQVLLLDETVFTIGPNSTLILDKFVYDPATGAGEVSASITQGVFRFITGKIARKKPSNMKVKLPVGTIGIFGTMVAGKVEKQRSMIVLLGPGDLNNASEKVGRIVVENSGVSVDIQRAGYETIVEPGAAPSPPFRASETFLEDLNKTLNPLSPQQATAQDPGQQSLPGDSGASASQAAGQDMASGGALLSGVEPLLEINQALAQVTSDANLTPQRNVFPDGITTWDELRRIDQPEIFHFEGTAPFINDGTTPCVGGAANCTGTWGVSVNVDFANRRIFGNSFINTTNLNGNQDRAGDYSNPINDHSVLIDIVRPVIIDPFGPVGTSTLVVRNQDNTPAKIWTETIAITVGPNTGVGQPITGSR